MLAAITEGDAQQQMREDIPYLTEDMHAGRPHLPGVTRNEAVRVFGRSARILIELRKSPDLVKKLRQSTAFKAAEIMAVLVTLVGFGLALF